MGQSIYQKRKKWSIRQKEIEEIKKAALTEFVQFSNKKNFWGRLKIAYCLLFKKIRIVDDSKQKRIKPWPKPQ